MNDNILLKIQKNIGPKGKAIHKVVRKDGLA
jgi:hypothetical protein